VLKTSVTGEVFPTSKDFVVTSDSFKDQDQDQDQSLPLSDQKLLLFCAKDFGNLLQKR
jgi:hypothetical protein